ncbi:MAG: sirohydrochlorin chelatase [Bellilinea sp.]
MACFNEFCGPSLSDAVRTTAAKGTQRVVVVTPMVTGGDHAEIKIPAEINQLQGEFPQVEMIYTWPFDPDAIT